MDNRNILFRKLWPQILDRETAIKVCRWGAWATIVQCIFSYAPKVRTLSLESGLAVFIDLVLYGLITWGILKMSRIAAIAGFGFYLAGRIGQLSNPYFVQALTIIAIFTFIYANSIRGAFAFHRFKRSSQVGDGA